MSDHVGCAYYVAIRDELVREYGREFGPLSRDAEIVLARTLDQYGDVVADAVGKARAWKCLTRY